MSITFPPEITDIEKGYISKLIKERREVLIGDECNLMIYDNHLAVVLAKKGLDINILDFHMAKTFSV